MKKIVFFASVFAVIGFTSCTQQERAKSFGGKITINLPAGQELVNATWKNSDLWYLTKQSDSTFNPAVYTFKESSNFGMMEGEVTFIESK
jgi:hypothetical protein